MITVSVYLCVFVCPRAYLQNHTPDFYQFFAHVTYGRNSVLLLRHHDTLCTSGFMDDVIPVHITKAAQRGCQADGSTAHTQL